MLFKVSTYCFDDPVESVLSLLEVVDVSEGRSNSHFFTPERSADQTFRWTSLVVWRT